MKMTLFVKDNKLCYTVGSIFNAVDKLAPLGWRSAGIITGRDMSGDFPTMTGVLKEVKDAKTQ